MLKSEVKAYSFYTARVSGKLTIVQLIDRPFKKQKCRWNAVNLRTGKPVSTTSGKCRKEVSIDRLEAEAKSCGFDLSDYEVCPSLEHLVGSFSILY